MGPNDYVPLEWTGSGYVRAIVLSLMSRKEENVHVDTTLSYDGGSSHHRPRDWWLDWTGELS